MAANRLPSTTTPTSTTWSFSGNSSDSPNFRLEGVRLGFVRAGYGTDWSTATRGEVSFVHYVAPDFTSLLDFLRNLAEGAVSQSGPFWSSIDAAAAALGGVDGTSAEGRVCTRVDFVWSILQAAVAKTYGVKFGAALWSSVMELAIQAPPMIMGADGKATRVKLPASLLDEVTETLGASEDGGKPYLKVAFALKSVRIVKSAKTGTYNAYIDSVMKGCSKTTKPIYIAEERAPAQKRAFNRGSIPDDARDAESLKAMLGM